MSNRFKMGSAPVYFAPPGSPMPNVSTMGHIGSDWQPLGYMDNRMGYDNDIDNLVSLFNEAIECGAAKCIFISDKYGAMREYRAGAGDHIREWMIMNYEPEAVESSVKLLVRSLAEHAAREDGVTTPLLNGAL